MVKPPPSRRPPVPDTVRVAGLSAVSALFARDPQRVERLFYDDRTKPLVGEFCRLLAAKRKPYRLVPTEELSRVAGSALHGGIVAVARPRPVHSFDPAEARLWARSGMPLLILDGVGNPHNLGAIIRTMAFFGLERLMLSDHPGQAEPSDAAIRVAEGGMEWVEIYRACGLASVLARLGPDYRVIATALDKTALPLDRLLDPSGPPAALVLGNEETGLPSATLAAAGAIATIPGGGHVQSLNVAASAAILVWELAKKRYSPPPLC